MMRTYQSRPILTAEQEAALAAYAQAYSYAERHLFAQLSAGENAGKLKPSFMREHELTARQFNALAISVRGKIKSLIEGRKAQIEDLKGLRRGTVRIACSQALAHEFLPAEIAAFRAAHPLVAFEVKVLDHERAIAALASYETDLVLVFRPPFLATTLMDVLDQVRTQDPAPPRHVQSQCPRDLETICL